MQKHWYIVYTKTKCEKKVAAQLTKRKIENFCPINCMQINQFGRVKLAYEPLFSSHVFVYMDENEINLVKQLNHVVNLVYWKGEAAIIQNEEIEEIKEFVSDYHNIKLERSKVNLNASAALIDRPSYSIDRNVVMIKNKFIKVNLPSLGYVMVAEMKGQGVMGRVIRDRGKEMVR